MPSLTLTTLAQDAAKYLMVLDAGGTLSSTQLDDALAAANDMLDNWSSEELMVPSLSLETFALVGGTSSYVIGPAATWNTARPMAIEAAIHSVAVYTGTLTSTIKVVNGAEWASIPNRDQNSPIIEYLFYDRATTNAKVYVSPIPLGGNVQLTLWKALTQFADKTTAITVPNGYPLAMKLAFAMILAPMYDMAPTEALTKNYMDAMARIRDLNAALMGRKPPAGQTDAATAPPTMIQTN